jgi:ParB-like chromosome segregation protein Spo0J
VSRLGKDVTYDNLLEIALIENIQREDLNPIEEGTGVPAPY